MQQEIKYLFYKVLNNSVQQINLLYLVIQLFIKYTLSYYVRIVICVERGLRISLLNEFEYYKWNTLIRA